MNKTKKKEKRVTLSALTLFQERVYGLCKQVPRGEVTTYKEIGKALGGKGQVYRAVGAALHKNPFAPLVPCHRVVCSDGSVGGFAFGKRKKSALLRKEGITVKKGRIAELENIMFWF